MSRVLIADDDSFITLFYSDFLAKEKNIEIVDIVHNGIDAYNSYMKYRPDVLLLDLNMPGMNGIELIDKLCEDQEEKKKNNIIVISGYLDQIVPYNTAKVYRMIRKNKDFNLLIDTINEIQEELDYKKLEEKIDDLFFKFKISSSYLKGTHYLKKAAIYCYYDENILYDNNLIAMYDKIALHETTKHITGKNVLWSLESLIDSYQKKVNKSLLSSYFSGYEDNRGLTPKYLLELLTIELKKQ